MTKPENHEVQEPNLEGVEMKMPAGTEAPTPATEQKSISGLIIVLLFLLLLLILGGLYYWSTFLNQPITTAPAPTRPTAAENQEPESTTARARTENLDVISTSNELDAIEADVESTNLDDLDAELSAIDAELDAAMSAQ